LFTEKAQIDVRRNNTVDCDVDKSCCGGAVN